MEEISLAIVEFVKQQPESIKHKYISLMEASRVRTDETFVTLVESGFSRKDLKILTDELSKLILDKFPFESVLTKLK